MKDYKIQASLLKDSMIKIFPAQKLSSFILHSGHIYKKIVSHGTPEKITRNGVLLSLVADISSVNTTTKYY